VVSRRAAEGLIVQGRVAVNGTPVLDLGSKADPQTDTISVDGKKIKTAVPLRYVLVNKPSGMVTTRSDPERRRTVLELIPPDLGYLYPVGRLDYDSEGLLLLTNDGELAARLMHPRHEVPKVYRARVRGVPDGEAIERLSRGIPLDGHRTAPASIRVLKRLDTPRGSDAIVDITLREGRNRQVRRMCEAVGHPVVTLSRVQFGPLRDPGLKVGHSRELTPREVKALQASAVLTTPTPQAKAGLGAPQKRRDGPRTRGLGAPNPHAPKPRSARQDVGGPGADRLWAPKPVTESRADRPWAPKPEAKTGAKAATAPPRPRMRERSGSAPRPRRPSAGGRPRRG
jgi:23S rRNA pseudouridine2605 synthase